VLPSRDLLFGGAPTGGFYPLILQTGFAPGRFPAFNLFPKNVGKMGESPPPRAVKNTEGGGGKSIGGVGGPPTPGGPKFSVK